MQIWINEPTILFDKNYIFEIIPTSSMCYEQQMNALSRIVILFTIVLFIFMKRWSIILSGTTTLAVIYFLYLFRKTPEGFQENNSANADIPTVSESNRIDAKEEEITVKPYNDEKTTNPVSLQSFVKKDFQIGTKKNPFSNVLLTEIMDDPHRKAAPPSFHPDILDDITSATKKTVQFLNPGIKSTNKQLFGSMTDKFYLDQSNRVFFSTPNTKIPNDQGAFADFLYGDMPSCRNGDAMACVQDNYRYTLY